MSDSDKITRWRYETPDGGIIGVAMSERLRKPYRIVYFNGRNHAAKQFLTEEGGTAMSFVFEEDAQQWLDDYADSHDYRVVTPYRGSGRKRKTNLPAKPDRGRNE